jgi:hypothetical protein
LTCGHRGKPSGSEEKLIDNLIRESGFASQHFDEIEKLDKSKQIRTLIKEVRNKAKPQGGKKTAAEGAKKIVQAQETDHMLVAQDDQLNEGDIKIEFGNEPLEPPKEKGKPKKHSPRQKKK